MQALSIVVWIVLGVVLLAPMGLAVGAVGMEGLLLRGRGMAVNGRVRGIEKDGGSEREYGELS